MFGGFSGAPGAVRRCSGVGGRGVDRYECEETRGKNPGSEPSHNARSAREARAKKNFRARSARFFFLLALIISSTKEQPGDGQKRKKFRNR